MADMELRLAFAGRDELESAYRAEWRLGHARLHTAAQLLPRSGVTLVLVHPETHAELRVPSTVERVESLPEPSELGLCRVTLRFVDDGPNTTARIGGFVAELGPATDELALDHGLAELAAGDELALGAPLEQPLSEPLDEPPLEDTVDAPEAQGDNAGPSPRIERLRNLNEAQRMQVARGNVLDDRVTLERLYGPAVWPLLLHNPKITVPEVARMARKGTMPRPLLDLIAENEHWIRQSLVRRALLCNPRLSPDSAIRVLRATSPRELKLVPQQTAYPMSVRTLAQRLLKGSMPRL